MKFGICTSFREIQALDDIPFDYLEESVHRFLIPEKPREDFADRLRDARNIPIPIETANSFLPADLPLVATPQHPIDRVRIERYVRTALERAEQVGIRVIVFGSGGARKSPPGYDPAAATEQILNHLATWSKWARDHGVTIALEPLQFAETNTLNTVAESATALSGIAASGARLLADTYHMACNGEDPTTLVPWGSLLAHVHVAEQQERAAPGTHGEDLRPYFSALHRAGYDQRISIECRWRNFVAQVAPAIAVLKEQWATSV
ncbi:MAG: hypothetical protein PVS3B1_38780 [Ktedonobacteraceae bacterium]